MAVRCRAHSSFQRLLVEEEDRRARPHPYLVVADSCDALDVVAEGGVVGGQSHPLWVVDVPRVLHDWINMGRDRGGGPLS